MSSTDPEVFFKCSSQDWLTVCYLIDKRKKVLEKKFLAENDPAKKTKRGRPFLPLPVLELLEVEGESENNVCFFSCPTSHFVSLQSLICAHKNVLNARERARKGGRKPSGHAHPVPIITKIEAQVI